MCLYKKLFILASPGKQITLPQSLITTTTVTSINNSGTIVTGASSSIINEMNKNPNSVLHAVASPSSTAVVSVSKNSEKVYKFILCNITSLLYEHIHIYIYIF